MWLKFLQAVFFGSVGIIIVVTGMSIAWVLCYFLKKIGKKFLTGSGFLIKKNKNII